MLENNEIPRKYAMFMSAVVIIPLIIVAIVGIIGYLIYRVIIFDYLCNLSVNKTLQKYNIKKTQFEIIKEYYENRQETISEKTISQLVKKYRQNEPEQFLAMYDSARDNHKNK